MYVDCFEGRLFGAFPGTGCTPFIAAGSFDAIAATDGIIRAMPESLRMVGIGDFPADQNYACSKERTPTKKTFDGGPHKRW